MGSLLQDIEFLNLNDVSEDESAFIQALLTASDGENEFPWEQNATRTSKIATKPYLANAGSESQFLAYAVQFPWDEPVSKTKGSSGNKTTSLNPESKSRSDSGINFISPAPTPVPVSTQATTIHTSSATPSVHYAAPLPPSSTAHPGHVYYIPQPFAYGGPSLLSPLTPNVYVNNMTANVSVHHGLHHVPYATSAAPPRHYAPEKHDKAASSTPVGLKRTNPPGSPTKRGPPPGTRRDDHPAYTGAPPSVVSVPAAYNIPSGSVYGGGAASLSFQGTPGTASYVTGQHFHQHTAQTATGVPFMVQQPYFYMAHVYPPPHAVSGYPEPIPPFDHMAAAASPVCAASPGTAPVPVPLYVSPDQRIEVSYQPSVVEENLEQVNSVTGDDFSPSRYIFPPIAAVEPPVTEDLVKGRSEVEPEPQNVEAPSAGEVPEVASPRAESAPRPVPEEDATQIAPTVPPSGGVGRSWASLFKSGVSAASAPAIGASVSSAASEKPLARVGPFIPHPGPASTSDAVKPAGAEDEAFARQLGTHLAENGLNHTHISLLPRGLTNKGNWCYINATLQALLACPAFVNLMRSLNPILALRTTPSSTPIIDSMVDFVGQFDVLTPSLAMSGKSSKKERGGNVNKKEEVPCGPHLEPGAVHRMLSCIRSETFKVEGRQEDAEEFLSCLLNGLHDEMAEVIKLAQKDVQIGTAGAVNGVAAVAQSSPSQDDDEWKLIGPKNKGMVTRSATFSRTPISDLFLGQMRSAVTHSGGTPTATLQPFFSLQLDIQNERVTSVQQALEALVVREALQGFTCSRTGTEVEATRQTTLEELPPVLLLHFKCFVYDQTAQAHGGAGIQKLIKRIDFSVDLELSKDFLSPSVRAKVKDRHRQYKLFAVVYHDGKEATKGHYVTDVHHQGLGAWLRYDDSSVKPLCDANLHKYNPPRMPYLLFYRRHDPTK